MDNDSKDDEDCGRSIEPLGVRRLRASHPNKMSYQRRLNPVLGLYFRVQIVMASQRVFVRPPDRGDSGLLMECGTMAAGGISEMTVGA